MTTIPHIVEGLEVYVTIGCPVDRYILANRSLLKDRGIDVNRGDRRFKLSSKIQLYVAQIKDVYTIQQIMIKEFQAVLVQ